MGNILDFVGHIVFVATALLQLLWSKGDLRQRTDQWVWLCANKTLFIKPVSLWIWPMACSLTAPGLASEQLWGLPGQEQQMLFLEWGGVPKNLFFNTPHLSLANDGNSVPKEMHREAAGLSETASRR